MHTCATRVGGEGEGEREFPGRTCDTSSLKQRWLGILGPAGGRGPRPGVSPTNLIEMVDHHDGPYLGRFNRFGAMGSVWAQPEGYWGEPQVLDLVPRYALKSLRPLALVLIFAFKVQLALFTLSRRLLTSCT